MHINDYMSLLGDKTLVRPEDWITALATKSAERVKRLHAEADTIVAFSRVIPDHINHDWSWGVPTLRILKQRPPKKPPPLIVGSGTLKPASQSVQSLPATDNLKDSIPK